MNAAACIGIVDDDAEIRQSLADLLDVAGYRTLGFASGAALIDAGIIVEMTCLLIDVRLAAGEDGIALLDRLRAKGVRTPVIVFTAHGDVPMAVRAMRAGAVDFLE